MIKHVVVAELILCVKLWIPVKYILTVIEKYEFLLALRDIHIENKALQRQHFWVPIIENMIMETIKYNYFSS